MSKNHSAAPRHSRISGEHHIDNVKGALQGREVESGDELSDEALAKVSGGASILSIIAGWGKTINPFDGTVGGSDDWGKTVDPFKD